MRRQAATNQDLEAAVRAARFREDLYYRLRVVEIAIPPLAERREDIPPLIDHFLKEAAGRLGRAPKPLTADAMQAACRHPWKGNVRELRSAVEQALLLAPGPEISAADLFGQAPSTAEPAAPAVPPTDGSRSFHTKAAEEVGVYRQNFQQKMRELGITAD